MSLFLSLSCGISCRFQQLSPAEGQVSYVLRTRSPLSLAGPFDLHVLGTPPAFILSQDQTLRISSAGFRPPSDDPQVTCFFHSFARFSHLSLLAFLSLFNC